MLGEELLQCFRLRALADGSVVFCSTGPEDGIAITSPSRELGSFLACLHAA